MAPVEAVETPVEGAQTAPEGLGEAGMGLWSSIAAEFQMEPIELVVLGEACFLMDRIEALEAEVVTVGYWIKGSTGQMRLNPALAEIRQSRLAVGRLLGHIRFPDDDGKPAGYRSHRARQAAIARWRPRGVEA